MQFWKDTNKQIYFINEYAYTNNLYWLRSGKTGWHSQVFSWTYRSEKYCYPATKDKDVPFATTLAPDSVLYFDKSSKFPRFKLELTTYKRCIKPSKADAIVVSGEKYIYRHTSEEYDVFEADNVIIAVPSDLFSKHIKTIDSLSKYLRDMGEGDYQNWNKIHSKEKLDWFNDKTIWYYKYISGEYTLPLIKDDCLDKLCCKMCPEPTFEELVQISDMLESQDDSTAELGFKMLTGYDIAKYRLSMRVLLVCADIKHKYIANNVAGKQLLSTLNLSSSYLGYGVGGGYWRIEESDTTYNDDDIALARQLSAKYLERYLKYYYKNITSGGYAWVPENITVKF